MTNLSAQLGAAWCTDTALFGRGGWLVLGIVLTAWLIVAFRRTQGSTLRAPVVWAAIAVATVIIVEVALGAERGPLAVAWRYIAAVSTFCPSMALLGAKRPQDRGWQFVVATLWLILALPAWQAMVFTPGSRLDLHLAWRWFLLLLVAVAVSNYLPTRFAIPALMAGAAQLFLLHNQLPVPWHGTDAAAVQIACGLWLLAMTLVGGRRPRATGPPHPADRVWRDFRDHFGAVWALRVMERINQAARQEGRQERLQWHGFSAGWDPWQRELTGKPDPLELTIRMLLRRFVSPEWIARRHPALGSSPPA